MRKAMVLLEDGKPARLAEIDREERTAWRGAQSADHKTGALCVQR